jgi:hypothetical protein
MSLTYLRVGCKDSLNSEAVIAIAILFPRLEFRVVFVHTKKYLTTENICYFLRKA